MKVPGTQSAHWDTPTAALAVPAAQVAHDSDALSDANFPAPQRLQRSWPARSVAAPVLHATQLVCPMLSCAVPFSQSKQRVDALSLPNCPDGQRAHAMAPGCVLSSPGRQASQADRPCNGCA